jgi:ATP-dependent DNA helicase RecG
MERVLFRIFDVFGVPVQKHRPIPREEAKALRRQKLVEGCFPNLFVAEHIAAATGDRAQHIKNRAFDDAHYKQMVVEYLRKYSHASRLDLDSLLLGKLSDVLTDSQKRTKLKNLIASMSRSGAIRNTGPRGSPKWILN